MDLTAVTAAVTSLRLAGDIAKGLISLHTMAEVQTKALELNEKLIEAQHRIFDANATQATLVERVRELEGQIARMKDWDAEKQRYQLVAPWTGALVYAVQESMSDGEPPHYLCTTCFQSGKPSLLQCVEGHSRKEGGFVPTAFVCPVCKTAAFTGQRGGSVAPQYAEKID